jgi:hypothetical protein
VLLVGVAATGIFGHRHFDAGFHRRIDILARTIELLLKQRIALPLLSRLRRTGRRDQHGLA